MYQVKGIQKLPEDTNLGWISSVVFFAKLCRVEHVSMDLYPLLVRSMQDLKSSLSKFADTDAYQVLSTGSGDSLETAA